MMTLQYDWLRQITIDKNKLNLNVIRYRRPYLSWSIWWRRPSDPFQGAHGDALPLFFKSIAQSYLLFRRMTMVTFVRVDGAHGRAPFEFSSKTFRTFPVASTRGKETRHQRVTSRPAWQDSHSCIQLQTWWIFRYNNYLTIQLVILFNY